MDWSAADDNVPRAARPARYSAIQPQGEARGAGAEPGTEKRGKGKPQAKEKARLRQKRDTACLE